MPHATQGWAALQAKLTSTDSARAAAARALAEQAASLEAAERARSRAEAAAAQAASSAASHAARAQSAAAKLADSERRHAVALRAMEDQLKAKEAALAAAEADRTQLVAALRDAVHAAKRAARAEAKEAKQAPLAPREEGAAVAAAEPTEVAHALSNDAALPAPVAPAAPPAQLVSIPEAEASPEMTVVPSKPAPPSARKAFAAPAPEERTTQWPGPPPRPIWSASPATLPLARYESKHVVKPGAARHVRLSDSSHAPCLTVGTTALAAVLPAPARTPPRAEALVTVAEAAAATSSSGMESSDSSQFDAGAENVICRTLGSARKRLNMSTLAVLGAPEDGHDIVREMASVTRPAAREERHREERRRDRSEPMPAPAAKLAPVAAAADIDKPVDQRSRHQRRGTTRSAREPERPARQDCVTSAAQPAHAKPAAKHHHHGGSRAPPAAALPSSKHALEALPDVGGLSPPPRAPLGRRSVNEMFLGLWEPSLGGATPSVPRRAAMQAQPRLAGWRLAGDAAEEFEE